MSGAKSTKPMEDCKPTVPGVDLCRCVSKEGPIRLLQTCHIYPQACQTWPVRSRTCADSSSSLTCGHLCWVHQVKLIVHSKDLYGAEGVQQVGVVSRAASKAPILFLTAHDPRYQLLLVKLVLLAQELQGSQAPVHPTETEVLRGVELEGIRGLVTRGISLTYEHRLLDHD